MKYRSTDMLAVIALTCIAITLACTVSANYVAVRILTLPLVFFLPGYALTALLFNRQRQGIAERVAFSLGSSLILVILSGLVLNLAPSGLSSGSWIALPGIITLMASVAALLRQRQRQGQDAATPQWTGSRYSLTVGQGLLLALAALIIGSALALSISGAEQQPYPGFTQLWMLPSGGAQAKDTVRLGVKNMEKTTMEYRLVINMGSKAIKQWSSLDLRVGENWQTTLAVPAVGQNSPVLVEALLYRLNAPTTPYRHVELWLAT